MLDRPEPVTTQPKVTSNKADPNFSFKDALKQKNEAVIMDTKTKGISN